MPRTAFFHFDEDIERARAIVRHCDSLPSATPNEQLLQSDLLRSAWVFAVGALDAYFCDAYTDVVAASIISKARQSTIELPDFFYDIKFPVRAILEPYAINLNWRWRMAARKMMERENVLRLKTIQDLFNRFFSPGRKFFHDLLAEWVPHPQSKKRMFGITQQSFNALTSDAEKANAVRLAWLQMSERFQSIFQRRHDCVHNCDRPKNAPQPLRSSGTVIKVIQDVAFLVHRSDDHINQEFHDFLQRCGCNAATIQQAGY